MSNRKPLFERLKAAGEDALAYAGDEKALVTRTIDVPGPKEYDPQSIRALREAKGLSQAGLAAVLQVDVSTLQNWEQGIRHPNRAAMRLLQFVEDPGGFVEMLESLGAGKVALRFENGEVRPSYGRRTASH